MMNREMDERTIKTKKKLKQKNDDNLQAENTNHRMQNAIYVKMWI